MIITTRSQQAKIGKAARKVGGYRELVRLSNLKRKTPNGKIVYRDGKWTVISLLK